MNFNFKNLISQKTGLKMPTLNLRRRRGSKLAKRRRMKIYCTVAVILLIIFATVIFIPKETETENSQQDINAKINVSLNHRTENPNAWLYEKK